MKTDVIAVSSQGSSIQNALAQAEKVAAYKGLSPKSALHLRLLAEEMLGMMRSITGEKEGKFWIEDCQGVYELHLRAATAMDLDKREQLLAVSSSGKNAAKLTLMERLRDFFYTGADSGTLAVTSPLMLPEMFSSSSTPTLDWEWSMTRYQEALDARVRVNNDSAAREAWDELEKSVVAHVADDIKVAIRGDQVEMTIVKKLS